VGIGVGGSQGSGGGPSISPQCTSRNPSGGFVSARAAKSSATLPHLVVPPYYLVHGVPLPLQPVSVPYSYWERSGLSGYLCQAVRRPRLLSLRQLEQPMPIPLTVRLTCPSIYLPIYPPPPQAPLPPRYYCSHHPDLPPPVSCDTHLRRCIFNRPQPHQLLL
jgi:hypothetical protein